MGIQKISANGIFEVQNGSYTKTYRFTDINYVTAGTEEQVQILKNYCKMVNAIDVYFMITIFNRNKDMQDFRENVLFQEKVLTVCVERKEFEQAKVFFTTFEATLKQNFGELASVIEPLNAEERIRLLFYFYRIGDEELFDFDFKQTLKKGGDPQNNIALGYMKFYPGYFETERKKYLGVENDILKQQQVRNRNNDFSSDISHIKKVQKEKIVNLMDDVRENDQQGVCYRINQISHNLCVADRKNLANGNGMVFGIPGSGKSYFSKSEMIQVFLNTEDDIICIDPTLEYFDIAEALGSQAAIINLSSYTKNYIDIAKNQEKHIPTMSEFYELLLEQEEPEAKDIALSLELFVNASLNIFNNHTNVNVQARFVVYGTRDLGKELGAISTLVMLENISARIAENAKIGRATWLYIDEFHTVPDREYSAKYIYTLWKKVRKPGGLCTGITQNIVDIL